jgi:ABC-type sugar transport system substrate-binding protein
MLPPMISRKIKHVVALTFGLGLGMAATPRDVAASSNSTIYLFAATDGITWFSQVTSSTV